MKRPWLRYSIEFLIFACLVAGALLLVRPISSRIEAGLSRVRDGLVADLERETGLLFSYDRLSPSIFRSLRFSGVRLVDARSGTKVVEARVLTVRYNIFPLLFGSPVLALDGAELEDAQVRLDANANKEVISKLKVLLSGGGESDSGEPGALGELRDAIRSGRKEFSFLIENLDLSYRDEKQEASLHVAKGRAAVDRLGIALDVSSKVTYLRPELTGERPISSGLLIAGTLSPRLDAGSASLTFSSIESSSVQISRMSLFVSYRDGVVTLGSVQDIQPIDVVGSWDTGTGKVGLHVSCDRLLPLRWIRLKGSSQVVEGLRDASLTGTLSVEAGPESLSYAIDLKADVPSGGLAGGGTAYLVLEGDREELILRRADFSAQDADITSHGSFDIVRAIPEGVVKVSKLVLPNGTRCSGDLFVSRSRNGFSCVIPEARVNDSVIQSLSLTVRPDPDGYDFRVSGFDGSGELSVEGSLALGEEKFLQLYASVASFNVGNAAGAALGLVPSRSAAATRRLSQRLSPYLATTELFLTSNLESVSYNCTRLVLASADTPGRFLLLSVKGNESSVDITDISLSAGSVRVEGGIKAGIDPGGAVYLSSSLAVNDIPYNLTGLYGDGVLSVYGDYGIAASFLIDDSGGMSGQVRMRGFPVPVSKAVLSLSLEASFITEADGAVSAEVRGGEIEEVNGVLPAGTRLLFDGALSASGLVLDRVVIEDASSQASGYAGVSWTSGGEGSPTQYTAAAVLNGPSGAEEFRLSGQFSAGDELMMDATIKGTEIPLVRFIAGQQSQDRISFQASVSGTPSSPMVGVEVSSLTFRRNGYDSVVRGSLLLADGVVRVADGYYSGDDNTLKDVTASYDAAEGKAVLSAVFAGELGPFPLGATIGATLQAEGEAPGSGGLSSAAERLSRFTAKVDFTDISWSDTVQGESFSCTVIREPGITALYGGADEAITGFYLDDGTVSLRSGGGMPIRFNADGTAGKGRIDVGVRDFSVDLARFWRITGVSPVTVEAGSITGEFDINGTLKDPDFNGSLRASDILARAPDFVGEVMGTPFFEATVEGKEIRVSPFVLAGKKGSLSVTALFRFDQWIPSNVTIDLKSINRRPVRLDTTNPFFKAEGTVEIDARMRVNPDRFDLEGNALFDDGAFALSFESFLKHNQQPRSDGMDVALDLAINVGKKVEFRWPTADFPIINGLVQADDPVTIHLDTAKREFQLKGMVNLKGGEIFYIKRSFYLRQGTISFNENQSLFDPIISLRADARERDEDGEPVRIILLADNQRLSAFAPILHSDPPRSDSELMALLGQFVSADTTRETRLQTAVVTASDLLSQLGVFRSVENKVRDTLNLDIFSIRTLILQNAIFGTAMQNESGKKMTIGNYFDNTTVYMGKYLGSAIYADALMHFSYFDPKSAQNTGSERAVYNNLLFQPEFGLEMATPFFNVRWSITPLRPETLFVSDNSITFSWKFSY